VSYNNNFESLTLVDGVLDVKGTSEPEPPGVTLISRHVAVRQLRDGKTTAACTPANLGQNWSATPALPGDGFELGDALAIGTDTHYRSTDSAEAFVTVTWSEIVAIESGA
jgi:hypothetical protein